MNNDTVAGLPPDVWAAVSSILPDAFGRDCRLEDAEQISGEGRRSRVWRCLLEGGSSPRGVIVKQSQGGDGARNRYFNEWSSLALIASLPAADPFAVRLYGADPELQLMVLEDLGDGPSLADLLLGDAAAAAEAGLIAYMRSLGRMHAATAGRVAAFDELRRPFGQPAALERWQTGLKESMLNAPAALSGLDLEWTPALTAEVEQVEAALLDPGPAFVLSHCDPCPDNNRLVAGELRHFDFEFAGFRHAMLDGAYTHSPFPTCWCVNRLPDSLLPSLEAAYRTELVRAVPEAADGAWFGRALVTACAYWLVAGFTSIADCLPEDRVWGISTTRQRLLYRFDVFSRLAFAHRHLEALASHTRLLSERLTALWPDLDPMPLYPAFRKE
jgi:hypothetical protein